MRWNAFAAGICLAGLILAESSRIKHVVVLQLENRAFDHMLGWMTLNNSNIRGLNSSMGNRVNPADPQSQFINVTDDAAYVDPDPGHGVPDTAQQIFGVDWWIANVSAHVPETMSGFITNAVNNTGTANGEDIMRCFHPSHVPIITTLASEFALSDAFFAAIPGPTFPNRLMTQSASTWGYGTNDVTQTLEGWPQRSIYSALTNASVSWRVYFEEAATGWLFQDTRNAESLANFKWMSSFVDDVAKGDLPQFTYMDPSYFTIPGIINATDQHPSHDVLDGERLMKTVYEALRASPLWNETVLLITYDEHGGFVDFQPPPTQGVPNPDGIPCRDCGIPFNFDRLGVRIPYLAISPWIARGTLIHAPPANMKPTPTSQMELSSIPATIHRFFNTNSFLNARDAWAVPLHWMWENTTLTAPRTDCPMTLPPVPAQSPSFQGKQMGSNPLSHLHRDLLYMVQGAFAGIRSKDSSDAHMLAEGLTTEASAGAWIRDTVAKHVGKASVSIDNKY